MLIKKETREKPPEINYKADPKAVKNIEF